MTTSNAADQVVRGFEGKTKNDDFSHVVDDIWRIQREEGFRTGASLDYINASVDMKALGFAEDFEILGIEEDGRMRTRGVSGQIQMRDGVHLQVESASEADVANKEWGGRSFTDQGDGNAKYTVQGGDTMWGISNSVMEERLGRKPTDSEIDEAYRQIAEANNITNADQIQIGQELNIPIGYEQSSRDPLTPLPREEGRLTEDSSIARGNDNVFNAMAAPGLTGTDEDWLIDMKAENVRRPDGSIQRKFSGQLDGWGGNDVEFSGHQSMDNNGQVTDSRIEYGGVGANIDFDNGSGNAFRIDQVRIIEKAVNPRKGN
jgi:hypothetical protein